MTDEYKCALSQLDSALDNAYGHAVKANNALPHGVSLFQILRLFQVFDLIEDASKVVASMKGELDADDD